MKIYFAWNISKYLSKDTTVLKQVPISTIGGNFVLDFVLVNLSLNNKIVVECDGKEFHDANRDKWRDATLLGSGYAEVIYRIRRSERGLININMLASKEVKNLHISDRKDDYILRYANDEAKNSNLIDVR